ncbi:unnamed protein product [Tilletia controversa]|uniref:Uncharacterized protein n=3 Tax=Tilletia TaxID=13289 RepID=A0A8X7T048_9BASI|nr:hypothetical protein CF328_g6948 [Tilletia controversa]KAE8187689.1 hypothetical protein CF336_g6471 [Tilletia laevis]KAE8264408.1 hypothetical protein A4X03_0g970 [Tilletia caries]KAE8190555.1 hypothetical protein CF335_g6328 [Tilletia laevis]KAE8254198.1 hypothetical protein A4X06_0g1013 [Tilletia controversa]
MLRRVIPATVASTLVLVTMAISQSNAQDSSALPSFSWNLMNTTQTQRDILCVQQKKYCSMSGCEDNSANITLNFCNAQTLGARCACNAGATEMKQSDWPIELADCQGRGLACKATCFQAQYSSNLQTCQQACDKTYTSTCATDSQFAADYSVMKENDKPSYAMIVGGTAGSVPGAASMRALMPSVGSSLAMSSFVLVFAAGVAVLA